MRISDWSSDVCSSDLCRGVSPLKGVGRISMTSCQAVPADLAARTRTAIAITSHLAGLRLLAWPGELYGGPVPVHRVPAIGEGLARCRCLERPQGAFAASTVRNLGRTEMTQKHTVIPPGG